MTQKTFYSYGTFAAAYGCGAYGADVYNSTGATCTTKATGTAPVSDTSGGGTLIDTGLVVLAMATVACAIICVSLVVRFYRRPRSRLSLPYHSPTQGHSPFSS